MSEATKPRVPAVAGATVALVLLTGMNLVNYLDRYILPAVQEQVKGEFHISDAQIGALTFWFMIAYMGVSPLTGWLGDRFSRKPMIIVAALAIATMNFLTASVHDYASLNFRHAALGVGEACFGVFAPAVLADFYAGADRNRVLTIFNIAIPVGAALGYTAGGYIGEHHGWRESFIASAIPGAIIAILIWIFMREPKRGEREAKKPADKNTIVGLLTNKAYLGSVLGYAFVTFSLGGMSWWIASFLQRVDGYSAAQAGSIMGPILAVGGLAGTITGGVIAQKWSKKTERAMYYVPALSAALAVAPALLCFLGPKSTTIPALACAIFLIFLGTGPVNAATLNAVGPNVRAAAMAGQLLIIHLLGDLISPPLIGVISDHSNLRIALSTTLIALLLAAVIFFIGSRYAPKLTSTVEAAAAA